ncbi:MAG: phosphatidate cytidylyltransferase [Deltaproteobacteria bacterium]|nr:phosphatidate cytidylyltransferase [Deltaproteobacteria bacterium]
MVGLLLILGLSFLCFLRQILPDYLNLVAFSLIVPSAGIIASYLELKKFGLGLFEAVLDFGVCFALIVFLPHLALVFLGVTFIFGFTFSGNIKFLLLNLFSFSSLGFVSLGSLFFLTARDFEILMVILGAVVFDTFSYFGGKIFGRNQLVPSISPNKTAEGFLFGCLGHFIFVYMYGQQNWFLFGATAVYFFSDLLKSKVKRALGIKDFGKILYEHGGILDRFDTHLGGFIFLRGFV